jgi:hypothetical protein
VPPGRPWNLYRDIGSGVLDPAEASLQVRVQKLRANRDLAQAALDAPRPLSLYNLPSTVLPSRNSPRKSNGAVEARKAWLNAIVDAIIVEPGKIRVIGATPPQIANWQAVGSAKAERRALCSGGRKSSTPKDVSQ